MYLSDGFDICIPRHVCNMKQAEFGGQTLVVNKDTKQSVMANM